MSGPSRPTASLAELGVKRRAKVVTAHDKDGDITGRIAAAPPALVPAPEPEAPPPPARRLEPPPRAEEIVVYWERLRRGRPYPALTEIDRALVGTSWPDSLIVAFEAGETAMPHISRLGETNGAIEYTPMVTDWILSCARHSARQAVKLDETQSFPLGGESVHYRLLLLPLGTSSGASGCVLCHLCPVS